MMTVSEALAELELDLPTDLTAWPSIVRAARNARLRAGSPRAIDAAVVALGLRWRASEPPARAPCRPALWCLQPLAVADIFRRRLP